MSDDQEKIETLYGANTTAVETVETKEDETAQQDDSIDELYPKEKEQENGNPYSIENSTENDLYGANEIVELADDVDLSIIYESEEEQAGLKKNLGYMASSSGADQAEITSLVETVNQQLTTGETYDQTEVMSTLYEQHGSDLTSKLAAAQSLVKSYPELSQWLDSTGAGDNPQVINQIIKIAASPRAQSRIQLLKNLKRGK